MLSGGRPLFGVLNVDPAENLLHLISGALLLYAAVGQRDEALAGIVAFGMGVVYALVGILGIVIPDVFGLFPGGLSIADDLIHLSLGAFGIVAAELTRAGPTVRNRPGKSGDDAVKKTVSLLAAASLAAGPMLAVLTGGPGAGVLVFCAGLVLLGVRALMGDGDRAVGWVLVLVGALAAVADLIRMLLGVG